MGLTDFINSSPQTSGPLTVDILESNIRDIWALVEPQPVNKWYVSRPTYKLIRRWERERVMTYETGVPIGGKRFRMVRGRWKVIQQ